MEKAKEHFLKATEIDPKYAEPHCNLGMLVPQQKKKISIWILSFLFLSLNFRISFLYTFLIFLFHVFELFLQLIQFFFLSPSYFGQLDRKEKIGEVCFGCVFWNLLLIPFASSQDLIDQSILECHSRIRNLGNSCSSIPLPFHQFNKSKFGRKKHENCWRAKKCHFCHACHRYIQTSNPRKKSFK